MVDNVEITAGSGPTIGADDISGVLIQRVKVTWGPDGTANDADIATGKPLPVQLRTSTGTAFDTGVGTGGSGTARVAIDSSQVQASAAHDAVDAGDPLKIGGYASAAAPSGVSGDADRVNAWFLRNGAQATVITAAGALVGGDASNGLDVDPTRLPAGEIHLGEVGGKTVVFDLTLSLDTSAYASGDLLADTQQADAIMRKADGTGVIQSLMVIDKDDQKMAFDVYVLDANVTLGSENSAPSISDANAASILGIINVSTSDYKDLGGVSVANIRNIGIPAKAVSGTDDLYFAVVNGTGAPTYTASGVVLRIGALLD